MLKNVKYARALFPLLFLLAHALENTFPFLNPTNQDIYLIMGSKDMMVVDFYFKLYIIVKADVWQPVLNLHFFL